MEKQREDTIRHLNEVLTQWRGARAQVWSYTAALATLEIRLCSDERAGNLYVVCSPCVSIAGPVHWDRCELAVGDGRSEEGLFVLHDERAAVRVVCRQVSVIENVEPLFEPPSAGTKERPPEERLVGGASHG